MKNKNINLSSREKLNLISNLATMLTAGIPIASAIHSLSEEARGNAKKILESVYEDLLRGKQLSSSFSKFPQVFDTVTINIIRASEESGRLDIILMDLKEEIKKEIAFNRKIKSALVYPILVMIVFIAVLLLILIVVIPKIATVFTQLKVDMPLPTKILIFASNALLHQTLYVVTGLTILVTGSVLLFKKYKKSIMQFLYKLPVLSRLVREIDLLHFSRSLHLLLSAGITINSALELTEKVIVNQKIAKAITDAKHAVLRGNPLSQTFKEQKKIFPSTMVELTQAGEKTGTLDASMHSISEYFEYQVEDTLSFLTALLEPVMLIIVAFLVGSMMLAIIGPIYGLIGQIGAR